MPQATLNPATGKPVSKKVIYKVFTEQCFDNDPNQKWKHQARLQKTGVSPAVMAHRAAYAEHMIGLMHPAAWWYLNEREIWHRAATLP